MSAPELTALRRPPAGHARHDWVRAAKRARFLSWISLVWMGAEGAIAITAGILAGSIALIGFGIDSAIEGAASLVIVWRFTGHRLFSHAAARSARRSSSPCSSSCSPPTSPSRPSATSSQAMSRR